MSKICSLYLWGLKKSFSPMMMKHLL